MADETSNQQVTQAEAEAKAKAAPPTKSSVAETPSEVREAVGLESDGGSLLSQSEIVAEVRAGKWGEGKERKDRLRAAGYSVLRVLAEANQPPK